MEGKRDFQRQKVYEWESRSVRPHSTTLKYVLIPEVITYIWAREGLTDPPTIRPLHINTSDQVQGQQSADGLEFHARRRTPYYVVLHELAHRMNSYANGSYRGSGHGSTFLGLYLQLLDRYLHLSMADLLRTADRAGLHYNLRAVPVQRIKRKFSLGAGMPA